MYVTRKEDSIRFSTDLEAATRTTDMEAVNEGGQRRGNGGVKRGGSSQAEFCARTT